MDIPSHGLTLVKLAVNEIVEICWLEEDLQEQRKAHLGLGRLQRFNRINLYGKNAIPVEKL